MPVDHIDPAPNSGGSSGPFSPSSKHGFYGLRNRLLAKDGFRRLMARLWPTGYFVRREARALFDLCAGFTYTQTLLALVEGGVITALSKKPQSVDHLRTLLGMSGDSTNRLLLAGQSIGLIKTIADDQVGLTLRGAALAGDPGILAMIRHHKILYQDLADPIALFKSDHPETGLNRYFGYAANDQADQLSDQAVADYSDLMASSQRMISAEILSAQSFSSSRHVLDIGGGYGAFARALLTHQRDVSVTVLDLPGVADKARENAANHAFGNRLRFLGGDFLKTPLPDTVDTITLVRVLFDHDDQLVERLLSHLAMAAKPGTQILVAEPMAETPGAEPVGHAYYGLYLKAMGQGRIRTADRHKRLLVSAGFRAVKEIRTPQPIITRLLQAVK